jgi:hypothetical protein
MPKITYTKQENKLFYIKPGDYVLEVVGYEVKYTQKGEDMIKLKLREIESGVTVFENLVFSEKSAWKIDTFVTAAGLAGKVGEEVDFSEEFLKTRVLGARCWAKVGDNPDKNDPKKIYNKVVQFCVDKQVPERAPTPPAEPKIADEDVPF